MAFWRVSFPWLFSDGSRLRIPPPREFLARLSGAADSLNPGRTLVVMRGIGAEWSAPLVLFFTEVLPLNSSALGNLPALLATLSDPRGRQGLRHPLAAMLAATVCGILTGARGCEAIAQWVRNQEPKIWHSRGFRRIPPCANTYRTLLARLPAEAFEELIQ